MTRARLNLLIDALMAVVMAAIAGLGFLINWVLIPGKERPAVYGGQPDLYWLGLDRHAWGDVHLVLGIALLVLLVLHVALHWGQVVGIWRRMVGSGAVRVALAVALLVLVAALMAFPAFVEPEVVSVGRGEGHGEGRGRGAASVERPAPSAEGGGAAPAADRPDGVGRGRGGEGRGLGRRGGGGRRGEGRGWRGGVNTTTRSCARPVRAAQPKSPLRPRWVPRPAAQNADMALWC